VAPSRQAARRDIDTPADLALLLTAGMTRMEQAARTGATAKQLTLIVAGARDPNGVEKAFAMLEKQRPEGVLVIEKWLGLLGQVLGFLNCRPCWLRLSTAPPPAPLQM
jgi:hypothetical protein